jgi:hypothetical protein
MHYQQKKSCTANVTVNRNRLKIYEDEAYLKDGQHFEIELYNPTDQAHLARISLNGKLISSSGIVLKPGERVYLERFLDEDRKFLFETYEVEDSDEAKKAIAKNGLLKIEFFSEVVLTFGGTTLNSTSWVCLNNPYNNVWTGLAGGFGSLTTGSTTATTVSSLVNGTFTSSNANGTFTSSNLNNTSIAGSLETGRIEKGEKSDQSFNTYYGSFNSFSDQTISIKLMPASAKPIEQKEIRSYCTECGTRMKKSSWKFCPNCGTKSA